jgi:hypothetical protein
MMPNQTRGAQEVGCRADDEPAVADPGGVSPGTGRCSALARIPPGTQPGPG